MSDLQMSQSDAMRYVGGLWLANRYQEEQIAQLKQLVASCRAELKKAQDDNDKLRASLSEEEAAP